MSFQFPKRQLITDREQNALIELLDRTMDKGAAFDRYGGVEVDAFEKEFADAYGSRYCTAVSSGTASIHTALAALRLEPGAEVICSPITDPGAVMPVVLLNLIPVFADCEPGTFNVSASSVADAITPRTGAIVVGHIAGEPADISSIAETAAKKNIPLIEDCSQSHLAEWEGKPIGTFGDMGVFSVMSGKQMTSGGQGGMIITDNEDLYYKCKSFADRGKPFGTDSPTNIMAGLNYRMTEIEACIGRVQLQRLPEMIAERRASATVIRQAMDGLNHLSPGRILDSGNPSWWFLRIHVDTNGCGKTKQEVSGMLKDKGVQAAPTYTTIIYNQKWFEDQTVFGSSRLPWSLTETPYEYAGCCPTAEASLEQHMMIAFHECLSKEDAAYIGDAIRRTDAELQNEYSIRSISISHERSA